MHDALGKDVAAWVSDLEEPGVCRRWVQAREDDLVDQ
jgi:hypothetical protein